MNQADVSYLSLVQSVQLSQEFFYPLNVFSGDLPHVPFQRRARRMGKAVMRFSRVFSLLITNGNCKKKDKYNRGVLRRI